jgi:two-component sensor histidine kinase
VVHGYPGRDRGRVRVVAEQDDDHVVITVEDDGDGMPTEGPESKWRLGLSTIAKLADDLEVDQRHRGHRLVMRFPARPL